MPEAQSRPSRHSTQAPFAGSQNCPRAAHALAIESHGEPDDVRTHVLSVHCCPLGQSIAVTQSTQNPRAMSHTCAGHMRELVHAVGTTQRLATQRCPAPVQSGSPRHSTHTARTRSHKSPRAEHSRSERQPVPASIVVAPGPHAARPSSADAMRRAWEFTCEIRVERMGLPRSTGARRGAIPRTKRRSTLARPAPVSYGVRP